jgi:hypothetical protein
MTLASPSGIGGITVLRRLVDTNRILTPCPSTPLSALENLGEPENSLEAQPISSRGAPSQSPCFEMVLGQRGPRALDGNPNCDE